MKIRSSVLFAFLALCTLVPGADVAIAQDRAPSAAPRELEQDSGDGEGSLDPELRQRFEELRRRRMAQFLQLDEEQTRVLDRELADFRRRQAELRRERLRLMAELRRELDSEERAEGELRSRLEALRRNQEARERAIQDLRQRLARGLTLEQQARLQLFAERFGRQLEEGARRLRERRGALGPRAGRGSRERPGALRDRPPARQRTRPGAPNR